MKDYDVVMPEKAKEELQTLIENFKEIALDHLKRATSDVYTEIGLHIESDSWFNYREQLRLALAGDRAWAETDNHWAQKVRQHIFTEHKNELIELINMDHSRKIIELERRIEEMQKWRDRL